MSKETQTEIPGIATSDLPELVAFARLARDRDAGDAFVERVFAEADAHRERMDALGETSRVE